MKRQWAASYGGFVLAIGLVVVFGPAPSLAQVPDVNISSPAASGSNKGRIDVNTGIAGDQVARRVPAGMFDIDIRVYGATDAVAFHANVVFDSAAVSFVGLVGPGMFGLDNFPFVCDCDPLPPCTAPAPGCVRVNTSINPCAGAGTGVFGDGTLVTLRFASVAPHNLQSGFDLTNVEFWRASSGNCPPPAGLAFDASEARAVVVIGDATFSCLNVNTTSDLPSINTVTFNPRSSTTPGNGNISLRSAVQIANLVTGGNRPTFRIPGGGNPTIVLGSVLPALSDVSGGTYVDGTTQPGGTVQVDGTGAATFSLTSAANTLHKLAVIGNPAGAGVQTTGNDNKIWGCSIGLNAAGTASANLDGVIVSGGIANKIGDAGANGNVISGNTNDGVRISGAGTTGTLVRNNKIGTDPAGNAARPNGGDGVEIASGAGAGQTVGGVAGLGNVISGNGAAGIQLASNGSTAQGNSIGISAAGNALPNQSHGIFVNNGASNVIGVAGPAQNVIGNNVSSGVQISGAAANGNLLRNNLIGLNAAGVARPNANGVVVSAGTNNEVGGVVAGQANVIAGNTGPAVTINGTASSTLVQNNLIGLTAANAPRPNGSPAVFINDRPNNTIGGVNATFRNVISANNGDGIAIQGTGATGNAVQNNYIGTTVNGLAALGNGGRGILIGGAGNNSIGGNTAGLGNVVSGNGFGVVPSASGIELSGCTAINTVQGNFVGTDNTGNNALPNAARGVFINGSANQQIGGSTAAARNFISGNTAAGVLIGGAASSGNQVQGNYIGLKATMAAALPNSVGVAISGAPDNIVGGGTPQHGNVISGNGAAGVPGHGVDISLAASTGNNVMSNLIGTNAAGTGAIPNRDDGVNISLGAHDNVIGGTGAGNIISKNGALPNLGGGNGVHITGAGTNGNLILGNSIGLPFTGSSPLGNLLDGVRISAGAEFNQIGGTLMSHRNVIGNNAIDGVKISGAAHNEVRNNLIGQDASGVDQPNTGHGVRLIAAAFDNTIVGNGIYANLGSGVFIEDPGTDQNEVLQNFIGAAAHGNKLDGVHIGNVAKNNVITVNNIGNNGTPGPGFEATGNGIHLEDAGTSGNLITANQVLGNLGPGVFISDEADLNVIGGDTPAAANVIDGNLQHGVRVLLGYDNSIRGNVVRFNNFSGVTVVDGTGNEISRNSIFSNNLLGLESGLGIDLSPSGVTANDAGDGDAGPNNLQNCPVLASAIGGTVSGMLESLGDRTFRIEFFSNAECDASGSGEGRTFIGSMNVTTDAGGAAEFAFDAPTGLPPDEFITATATDLTPNPIGPSNNTSEFSTCAAVMPAPSQAPCDLNCDGGISGLDVAAFTLAVLDPAGYAAQFPGCDILNGDCNDDTATGLPDASGFVLCLLAADSTGVCPP